MSKSEIEELVRQEGKNAAAEERIISELVRRYPPECSIIREHTISQCEPTSEWYINTDLWRAQIRKAQGRKRERRT